MGTYAYFASVFWALSLVVGTALSIQSAFTIPVYFTEQRTLFPVWPVIDPAKALYLFMGTIAVVLLPKVLGAALVLFRGEATGRVGWFLLGVLTEVVFSVLIAPIFMLTRRARYGRSSEERIPDGPSKGAMARRSLPRTSCDFMRGTWYSAPALLSFAQ